MSDLIERAEKCAKDSVGTLGRDMIEELIAEIVQLTGDLVEIRDAYAGANKDRLRLYKRFVSTSKKDARGGKMKR